MSSAKELLSLVVILGPTASGKSALAIWLAERCGGEVLACDSTQLYRGFDVGTAKPAEAERRGIPHHLMDVLEPHETATAGTYREKALAVLEDLRQRGSLPILTVGTGLYMRALLEGFGEVPQRSEELRERLRTIADDNPPGYLHRLLKRVDREAAEKIAAPDEQKIIRAIEVCILARKRISEVHRSGRAPLTGWRILRIGLMPSREVLYERIHARTDSMLERGWMEEVKSLLAQGLAAKAKPFDFIGYREIRNVVLGNMKLADARAAIEQSTRRYAKRQLTWFRREAAVQWFTGFGDDSVVQSECMGWLQRHDVEMASP